MFLVFPTCPCCTMPGAKLANHHTNLTHCKLCDRGMSRRVGWSLAVTEIPCCAIVPLFFFSPTLPNMNKTVFFHYCPNNIHSFLNKSALILLWNHICPSYRKNNEYLLDVLNLNFYMYMDQLVHHEEH